MYKLLLVSDKEEIRMLYESFSEWENLGFERPAVAANAQQGIDKLKHDRFDAVSSLLSISEGKQFFAYLARRPEMLGMETARDEARLRREDLPDPMEERHEENENRIIALEKAVADLARRLEERE